MKCRVKATLIVEVYADSEHDLQEKMDSLSFDAYYCRKDEKESILAMSVDIDNVEDISEIDWEEHDALDKKQAKADADYDAWKDSGGK